MAKSRTTWESLGGNNEDRIGGNGHVYQHTNEKGEKTTVLVDCGSMFSNKEETGYDTFIPNMVKYFDRGEEKAEEKPAALVLTYGHEDHIGGIAHYSMMGYKMPKVYGSPFTIEILKAQLAVQRVNKDNWPEMEKIEPGKTLEFGDMKVETIPVAHSIPDAIGLYIKTPDAKIFHSGDMKSEENLPIGKSTDIKRMEEISKEGVDACMVDSTSVVKPGMTAPESEIRDEFTDISKELSGKRMIVPVIARSMQRFASLAESAAETGRTIVLYGSSLTRSVQALKGAGYDLEKMAEEKTGKPLRIIDGRSGEAENIPKAKIMAVCTGTQAEELAALNMASLGKHRGLRFNGKSDALVMAQSAIPGNEGPVEEMLARVRNMGVQVITSKDRNTHTSGHGAEGDVKKVFDALTKNAPEKGHMTGIPVHGGPEHLKRGAEVAHEFGLKSLVHPNASKLDISKEGVKVDKEGAQQATWVGVDDKNNDFRDPDFQYDIVTPKHEKLDEISYDKSKAMAPDPRARGGKGGRRGGKKNKNWNKKKRLEGVRLSYRKAKEDEAVKKAVLTRKFWQDMDY